MLIFGYKKMTSNEDEKSIEPSQSMFVQQKHGIPALLSFFIPGLGQIVKKEVGKGVVIFIGFVVGIFILVLPGLFIWIWQLVDAYNFQPGVKKEKPSSSALKIIGLILFLLAVVIKVLLLAKSKEQFAEKLSEPENQLKDKEILSEEWKNQIAREYCSTRKDKSQVYYFIPEWGGEKVDLEISEESIEDSEPNSAIGTNLTEEDCKAIVDFMVVAWNKEDIENISKAQIWTGMNALQTAYSLGMPSDQNKTVTQHGVSVQWVYGNPIYAAAYVYFDGKDIDSWDTWILTSWQE